jgi:hypothetical protein
MPIEIRELHIKVAVTAGQEPGAAGRPVAASDGGEQVRQAIVAECVEQVLRILQNKMER